MWIKTGDMRYVKRIDIDEFKIIQVVEVDYNVFDVGDTDVKIGDHDDEDLEYEIEGYFESLDEAKAKHGDDWMQVVAEIMAGTQPWLEEKEFLSKKTALRYIKEECGINTRPSLLRKTKLDNKD